MTLEAERAAQMAKTEPVITTAVEVWAKATMPPIHKESRNCATKTQDPITDTSVPNPRICF